MNRKIWLLYVLALHVVVLGVLAAPGPTATWITKARAAVGARPDRPNPMLPLMRTVQERMDASVPAGATIFLGDSITQSLATAAAAPVSVNYGISAQRSDELVQSMDLYRSMARAQRVVILIGTNDLLQLRSAGIEQRYRAVLAKVPPNVPATLVSVPPLAPNIAQPPAVREVVAASRAACSADPRCSFVDAFSALSQDGLPQPGVLLPDGVHLSPAGYARLLETLKSPERALAAR